MKIRWELQAKGRKKAQKSGFLPEIRIFPDIFFFILNLGNFMLIPEIWDLYINETFPLIQNIKHAHLVPISSWRKILLQ